MSLAKHNVDFVSSCKTGDFSALANIFTKNLLNVDTAFCYACSHGHLDVAKWIFQFCQNDCKSSDKISTDKVSPDINISSLSKFMAFEKACKHGHLDVVKWIVSTFHFTDDDITNNDIQSVCLVCAYGHLKVLKWISNTFNIKSVNANSFNNKIFLAACGNGHLELAQWLLPRIILRMPEVKIDHMTVFVASVCNDHVKVSEWLIDTFQIQSFDNVIDNITDNISLQFEYGQFNKAKWFLETFLLSPDDAHE